MNREPIRLDFDADDYCYFRDNQLLSADPLNQAIDYLDVQGRRTRAYALGSGIVQGLVLAPQVDGDSLTALTVSPGTALTTDGDLLHVPAPVKLDRWQKFRDPNAGYSRFRKGDHLMEMFELTPQATAGADAQPFSSAPFAGGFRDFAVLLYQESWLEQHDECDLDDCDAHGPEQVSRMRVLLVGGADADRLMGIEAKALKLDEVAAERIDITSPIAFGYEGDTGLAKRFEMAARETRKRLLREFEKVAGAWSPGHPLLGEVCASWPGLLASEKFRPGEGMRGMQYHYAFFHDLAEAYNEWLALFQEQQQRWLKLQRVFPKHVLLGELEERDPLLQSRRHRMQMASALGMGDEAQEALAVYAERVRALMVQFRHPGDGSVAAIRITPSRFRASTLGDRAIPYYYSDDSSSRLRRFWNARRYREESHDRIHSYHAQENGALPATRKPFEHDVRTLDFLRIEGHIGVPVEDAVAKIEELKSEYNLPFKVELIQLGNKPAKTKRPYFRFPDLDLNYRLLRSDIQYSGKQATQYVNSARTKFGDAILPELGPSVSALTNLAGSISKFAENTKKTPYTPKVSNAYSNLLHFDNAITKAQIPVELSPIHEIFDNRRFRDLDLIRKIFDSRKEKAQTYAILKKFYEIHPGLSSQGGVPVGGTFILLYDDDDEGTVLGDFSLPYYLHLDIAQLIEDEEEEEEIPDVPTYRPPKDRLEILIQRNDDWTKAIKTDLDTDVSDLKDRFDDIKREVDEKIGGIRVDYDKLFKSYNVIDAQVTSVGKTVASMQDSIISGGLQYGGVGGKAVAPGGKVDLGSSGNLLRLKAEEFNRQKRVLGEPVFEEKKAELVKELILLGNAEIADIAAKPSAELDSNTVARIGNLVDVAVAVEDREVATVFKNAIDTNTSRRGGRTALENASGFLAVVAKNR